MNDDVRWQMAFGAIAGSLLADATADSSGIRTWSARGQTSVALAESLLAGEPTPIDLPVNVAIPTAIGLASSGCPLLADPATTATIDLVADVLRGNREDVRIDQLAPIDPSVEAGLQGLAGGAGSLSARAVSSLVCPEGRRRRRYLSGLAHRLLGTTRPDWYDPKRRRGPKEVLDGLWLSNIHGIARFVDDHPNGLVLSLCDLEGRLDDHRSQITFHLDDTPKPDPNPHLPDVVDEVLTEIRTARAAKQPVLVHCRHGASRTGLVLRALLIEDHGLDAEQAVMEAQCIWPATSTWNTAWAHELDRRATLG